MAHREILLSGREGALVGCARSAWECPLACSRLSVELDLIAEPFRVWDFGEDLGGFLPCALVKCGVAEYLWLFEQRKNDQPDVQSIGDSEWATNSL
jgi:hypothetical protein